jgi:hypothetical protein
MKKSVLQIGYYVALFFGAVILGWAALATRHSHSVRTDVGVIGLCNLAFWLFAFYVLRKGELRTGGNLISLAEEPRRFSAYFGMLLLMALVFTIGSAWVLISKASRLG